MKDHLHSPFWIGSTMTDDRPETPPDDPSLSRQSRAYRIALRLGFAHPVAVRPVRRIGLLALVTSVPLLLVSLATGLAYGEQVEVPLLRDPAFYCRYLVALPLLILSDVVVARGLAVQSGYFLESGLILENQRSRFTAAEAELKRLFDSIVVQGVILVLSYVLVITLRTVVAYSAGSSNWERLAVAQGGAITWAGWWSILVCLPILVFLLLRWFWKTCAWAWFLFRVSRLELELTPTHPDRAGGLGFLAWGQASFAPVLAAVSAVLSGSFAGQVLYAGESMHRLKYHLMVFVVLSLGFLLAPLLVFSRKLAQCRFRAVLDFGMLIWRHDRAFDEKWVRAPATEQKGLLGCPDVSSLANIAAAFEHVERMRVVPLDHQAVIVLFLAAMVPMLPFVASTIPLTEILKELGVFMV
jgi:hypothetical protein